MFSSQPSQGNEEGLIGKEKLNPVQELSTYIIATAKIKSQNWKMDDKLMKIK